MPRRSVVPGFRFDAKRGRACFEVLSRGRLRRRRRKTVAGSTRTSPTSSCAPEGRRGGSGAFCSAVLGEKNPAPSVEKTKTSKADLIAALKGAFAYCDKAYDSMNDASATGTVKLMGRDTPKLGALTINNVNTSEHYGNLVTYLRMRNIVPPTSEPAFMQEMMK